MKILVIGSGPIVIGQAAEFDYSGVQACKQLKKEGIEVIIVNSNPATIMTDENIADKIYIEPLTTYFLEQIIANEKPDAILAGFGGQTSLNRVWELQTKGILKKYNVKLLGTNINAIVNAENRQLFKALMTNLKIPTPESIAITNIIEAKEAIKEIKLPVIIRPAFSLGGKGNSLIYDIKEFDSAVINGLNCSPIKQILLEKGLYGFKELEFEVIRDKDNNCITVCTMENMDPLGIHTGDSIVIAPIQTVSKETLHKLEQASYDIISALKIEGGCNIQYAINPKNEKEYYVIEVNPRVSRSSALASKATGFPIAKICTKLALGYKLTDLTPEIKKLEPKPDYVAVKIPQFSFDKFENINRTLTSHMKSTGEIMAIGKTFEEAMQKGLQSIDEKYIPANFDYTICDDKRIYRIINALNNGISPEKISQTTHINKYFINKLKNIKLKNNKGKTYFYDIKPIPAINNSKSYFYSSKQKSSNNITIKSNNKKILVIGSGPIKIGQGIEFDYCSVQAVKAIKENGYEALLINSNPETLSTDYDIATRLYFEPITPEYINNIIQFEKPDGIIVQFGGQTAINILPHIKNQNIIGTTFEAINITENRILFNEFLSNLDIPHPKNYNRENIKFPAVFRPSYVIGGFGIQIAKNNTEAKRILKRASEISTDILIDEYIHGLECEADIISDGKNIIITGFIEHIEKSGVHSGDSIGLYPSINITELQKNKMTEYALKICKKLKIKGLINIQYVINGDNIYVIEANPRASRTIPMMTKMTGFPICETAINIMFGKTLGSTKILDTPNAYSVKIPIFSFAQLGIDNPILNAQMQSTGEALGIDFTFPKALHKAFIMGYEENYKNLKFSCKDTQEAYNIIKKQFNKTNELTVKTINNYIKLKDNTIG